MSKKVNLGRLPAGKYAVGDPTYILSSADFNEFWRSSPSTGIYTSPDGPPFAFISEFGGDGTYEGTFAMQPLSFPVDTGCLVIVPKSMYKRKKKSFGFIEITFDRAFNVSREYFPASKMFPHYKPSVLYVGPKTSGLTILLGVEKHKNRR